MMGPAFALSRTLTKQILFPLLCLGLVACGSSGGGQREPAASTKPKPIVRELETPVCVVDRFRQPEEPVAKKTDVLFVMDGSVSMHRHWQLMARSIGKLIRELPANEDIRFSVVLGTIQKFTGQLFSAPSVPLVLSNKSMTEAQIMASLQKTFAEALKRENLDMIGAGEALFYSLHDAITAKAAQNQTKGFFRPDAALNVIFMSDDAEESYPYPSRQIWGLPNKCNWAHHERMRKIYYLPRGIDADSTFAALRRLKGDMPLLTSAFVNITKEDILVDNSLDAHCIYDSPGFGYFDIVKRSGGVLYSIHGEKGAGLSRVGRLSKARESLIQDFRLSKPADKVDSSTIKASVDSQRVPHAYSSDTNVVHLENAGKAGSLVEIEHCEPVPLPDWQISEFSGSTAQFTASLSWKTGHPTSGKLFYGTEQGSLNDVASDSAVAGTHSIELSGLRPNTTYFFQAISGDEFGRTKKSELISLRTRPDWQLSQLQGSASRNSASLQWQTAAFPTLGFVAYGKSPDNIDTTGGASPMGTSHSIQVNGLEPNTVYFFRASSLDEFGLLKNSTVISLRTISDWSIVGFQGRAQRNTAQLSWATPEFDTVSELHFGTAPGLLNQVMKDPLSGRTHSVSLNGLAAGTAYFFQAVAIDSLGLEKKSTVISLTTLPDWSLSPLATASTESTFTVGFSTPGFPTDGNVRWGTSASELANALDAGAGSVEHAAIASGLPSGTLFFVQAIATDSLGLERKSAVTEVRTKTVVEPLPKWEIRGLEAAATTDSVTLTWLTDGYPTVSKVLWGSSPDSLVNTKEEADAVRVHRVEMGGLTPNSTFFFQVVAHDDKGQEARSSVIAVRTQALPLPIWEIANFSGVPAISAVSLSWETSGYPTKGKVRFGKSATELNLESPLETSPARAHLRLIEGLEPNTSYFFQVSASDDRGQAKESAVIQIHTLAASEPTWQIVGFDGTTTPSQANLVWQTPGESTNATVKVGLSAEDLSFRTVEVPEFATTHIVAVTGLAPNTTFFFQVVATDRNGGVVKSGLISKRTKSQ